MRLSPGRLASSISRSRLRAINQGETFRLFWPQRFPIFFSSKGDTEMLKRGIDRKVAGRVYDIRPALTKHDSVDGAIVANFDQGGLFRVVYFTRFSERRIIDNLRKPEASVQVATLRKRGYRVNYEPMPLF
jgi:hypothetical protein